MQTQMLAPAAVLVAWTLIMLLWMGFTRMPALKKAGIDARNAEPGRRGNDLEGIIPAQIQWKAHNYNHLMEQPTIFYALVAILAIAGAGALDVTLAWTYVALRIAHSIWQATVNRIPVRLTLFTLSSLCLIPLTIRALQATLFAGG